MSTPVTEQAAALQIEATSRALRLPTVREQAGPLAEAALRDRLTHLAYLAEVLSAELDDRDEVSARIVIQSLTVDTTPRSTSAPGHIGDYLVHAGQGEQ